MEVKVKPIKNYPAYSPSDLLDELKTLLNLKNDLSFSKKFGFSPCAISKLRHKKTVVTAHFLLRIHDISEIPIFELKKMMKDNRKFFR
jgi:hypothetical protein